MKGKANRLILGTRKGLLCYERRGETWNLINHSFAGVAIAYSFYDQRTGLLWAAQDHGHWGQKLSRSEDFGESWQELPTPKYPDGAQIKEGVEATMKYLWVLAPGHDSMPNTIYAGTEPGGLFVSHDRGESFSLVEGLWNHPSRTEDNWFGGGRDTPGIHSVFVDPRDPKRIFVAVSCAGVFESTDGGESWQPRNKGMQADFLPDPNAEVGQDPHYVAQAPGDPNTLWQQNHCGIYLSRDAGLNWNFVSQKGGPAHFGFAVAVDPHCPERAWVIPAVGDEKRMAIDGALVVCRTDDGGANWTEQRQGLPQENCYDIVYRHGLDIADTSLVFGTTTGNAFVSDNGGESWSALGSSLPPIYCCRFAKL